VRIKINEKNNNCYPQMLAFVFSFLKGKQFFDLRAKMLELVHGQNGDQIALKRQQYVKGLHTSLMVNPKLRFNKAKLKVVFFLF
jgi:hypothetical protein